MRLIALFLATGCGSIEADKIACGEGTRLSGSTCVPDGPSLGVDSASPSDTGADTADADADGVSVAEGDCDDDDPTINPDALEVCDGVDNDCDGAVDDDDDSLDGSTAESWYPDNDGDGFGAEVEAAVQCTAPAGHVASDPRGFDCNDDDADFHPGAREDDCGDLNDYNCDGSVADDDNDGDGFAACEDCNDSDGAINPGTAEACDGVDNDCNGLVDDEDISIDPSSLTVWYADNDDDGHGDDDTWVMSCAEPEGHVATAGDCDDDDPLFHPGADESDCGDPSDYNCDGSVSWTDGDGDGWAACEECDDANPLVHPDAAEVCNGIDDDCNGAIDDDDPTLTDALTWYIDYDDDGYGSAEYTRSACYPTAGWSPNADDCDDGNSSINPDAPEVCNGIDDDCDGDVDDDDSALSGGSTWYIDYDGDGFGSSSYTIEGCSPIAGWSAVDTDCDDTDGSVSPGASEVCNGFDDDCDGDVDDEDDTLDLDTTPPWYEDADGDGYGDPYRVSYTCDSPGEDYVVEGTDCHDGDADRSPGAEEIAGDGVDNNCENDPPTIALVTIDPAGARTADTLSALIDADDPDGDDLTPMVMWSVDGEPIEDAGDTLDASFFVKGQDVTATAIVLDGELESEPMTTTITIQNTPPTAPGVSITPSAPVPEEDSLVCLLDDTADDADGDEISFVIEWLRDGSPEPGTETTTHPGDTVPASAIGGEEAWTCRVTPTDGEDAGGPVEVTVFSEPDPTPSYAHDNGMGVTWYNDVPTGTMTSDQARLSCEQSHGSCTYRSGDCAGDGWCAPGGTPCWGWTSGCSGGAGRVWQYGSSYTTYGTWN